MIINLEYIRFSHPSIFGALVLYQFIMMAGIVYTQKMEFGEDDAHHTPYTVKKEIAMSLNMYPINGAKNVDAYNKRLRRRPTKVLADALAEASRPLTQMQQRVASRCFKKGLDWAPGVTVGFISKRR